MNTDIPKSFFHSVEKIRDNIARDKINQAIRAVKKAKSPGDIPHLLKVGGDKDRISYRIKAGKYRIGIEIENDLVKFIKVGRRDNFYNTFPMILFI